jgi:transcriptional regulator with XRE-family HTH domain
MATLRVPDRVGDLGGYLREQRESARLSLRQLASVAGVSNPYLSQIERGLRRPSAEVLQQIAKGLQISAEALFLRAGLLEDSGGREAEVAIQSDIHLTARQKRVLLDIYATFRAENARAGDPTTPARAQDAGAGPDEGVGAKIVPLIAPESLKSAAAKVDATGENAPPAKRSPRKRAAAKRAATKRAAGPARGAH